MKPLSRSVSRPFASEVPMQQHNIYIHSYMPYLCMLWVWQGNLVGHCSAELRHQLSRAWKGWWKAFSSGKLKVSPHLSCPVPPAFGLAAEAVNLIYTTVHIVWLSLWGTFTAEVQLGGAYYQCRIVWYNDLSGAEQILVLENEVGSFATVAVQLNTMALCLDRVSCAASMIISIYECEKE